MPNPSPSPGTGKQIKAFLADPRIVPFINYALLLFMVMTVGMTGVLALIIATFAEDKAPDWIKSHYEFQRRTFWVGIGPILVTTLVFMLFSHVAPQPVLMALIFVSLLVVVGRCIMGFNHLLYHRPYPNPKTWTV